MPELWDERNGLLNIEPSQAATGAESGVTTFRSGVTTFRGSVSRADGAGAAAAMNAAVVKRSSVYSQFAAARRKTAAATAAAAAAIGENVDFRAAQPTRTNLLEDYMKSAAFYR